MQDASTRIKQYLIFFVILVVIVKNASMSGFFEAKDHKGRGYYVKVPAGWKKVKKQKDMVYPEGVEVTVFVPQETDLTYGTPDAYISVFTKKLSSPVWIQDEIPDIRQSIIKEGNKIMDKGQIKIDNVISEWMVYHDPKTPALVLEFYMVTDNNIFYKMQYAAPPEEFNALRKSFEEFKESFRFRFAMY